MRRWQRLSISVPRELAYLVRATVKAGLYASVSEVVRDALRTWQAANPAVDEAANAVEPPVVRRRRHRAGRRVAGRGDPRCGLTERQLSDLEILVRPHGCTRLALRGSMRKLKVAAAAEFTHFPSWTQDREEQRAKVESELRYAWNTQVNVVHLGELASLDGWTVVYDAGLLAEASDTDSSSTS